MALETELHDGDMHHLILSPSIKNVRGEFLFNSVAETIALEKPVRLNLIVF